MSIETLKDNLRKQIDALDDFSALELLHDAAVDYNNSQRTDMLDSLTAEQQNRLSLSLLQANQGNTIPHTEAMEQIRKWRTK